MNLINTYRNFIKFPICQMNILVVFLLLIGNHLKAQENFKVGDFLTLYRDSLTVSYNSMGHIAGKNVVFTRKGKRDPLFMNFVGDFKDYDMKGNLAFNGTMLDNYLNGNASYYYADGTIKEEGKYKNDVRIGIWKYYYPNGKLAKLVTFNNGEMMVTDTYSERGEQVVKDGNGKVVLYISKFSEAPGSRVSGLLKNSKPDGKWVFYNTDLRRTLYNETFENGRFISGKSFSLMGVDHYVDYPRVVLKTFYPNEAVDLSDGEDGYPRGIENRFSLWEFGNVSPKEGIYQMLLDSMVGKYKNPIVDQWIIVGFKINIDDSLSNINISSSSHDETLNKFIHDIFAKSTGWKSCSINGKKESANVFFSFVIKEKKILFPAFFRNIPANQLEKSWDDILPKLTALY